MFPNLPPLELAEEVLNEGFRLLADAMEEAFERPIDIPQSKLPPAIYTTLGQFISHDLQLDLTPLDDELGAIVDPFSLSSFRSPAFDLDSVYGMLQGLAPHLYSLDDPGKLSLGRSAPAGSAESEPLDLPRAESTGIALLGDRRNDENLLLSQLHVLFIRFHNAVLDHDSEGDDGPSRFNDAKRIVTDHYQWMVVNDYLPRVLDPNIYDELQDPRSRRLHFHTTPFIPVEFSAAAFRFGHGALAPQYDLNQYPKTKDGSTVVSLMKLLQHTARGGSVPVPSDWLVDWSRFVDLGDGTPVKNVAYPIGPRVPGMPPHVSEMNLALMDLRRGVMLGLPSGQDVARNLHLPPLAPDAIATGPDGEIAVNFGMHHETPLWYYILKEAEHADGTRLGPVGSRIIADTIMSLMSADESTYLNQYGGAYDVPLGTGNPRRFDLSHMVQYVLKSEQN